MGIQIYSFSVKRQDKPKADIVVSCLDLPNPWKNSKLKPLDGRHPAVQDYVVTAEAQNVLDGIIENIAIYDKIAFYCYGGHHRSPAMAERMAQMIRGLGETCEVEHLEL